MEAIKAEYIISIVKDVTGVKGFLKKTRERDYVVARFIAFHFLRKYSKKSLSEIGKVFGDRHYSTVIHGLQELESYLKYSEIYKKWFEEIEQSIFNLLEVKKPVLSELRTKNKEIESLKKRIEKLEYSLFLEKFKSKQNNVKHEKLNELINKLKPSDIDGAYVKLSAHLNMCEALRKRKLKTA